MFTAYIDIYEKQLQTNGITVKISKGVWRRLADLALRTNKVDIGAIQDSISLCLKRNI